MVRSDVRIPDQSCVGHAAGAGRRRLRAVARPAVGRPAPGHPRRPPARRQRPAAQPPAGHRPRLLPLGRHRGLRPARRRGLAPGAGRLRHPGTAPGRRRRRAARARPPPARAPRIDLAPGLPDLRSFPLGRWVGALRSVASTLPYAELGYPDPTGHPRLRRVLAEYLGRVRGAVADPAHLTVCRGVADGTGRLCLALRAAGVEALAVEEPGWHRLRDAAASAGLRVVAVPVDSEGVRVADLEADPAVRAVLVSPTHQFPTGVV